MVEVGSVEAVSKVSTLYFRSWFMPGSIMVEVGSVEAVLKLSMLHFRSWLMPGSIVIVYEKYAAMMFAKVFKKIALLLMVC